MRRYDENFEGENYIQGVMPTLDEIASVSDQKQRVELYKNALQEILASGSARACKPFLDHSKFSCDILHNLNQRKLDRMKIIL